MHLNLSSVAFRVFSSPKRGASRSAQAFWRANNTPRRASAGRLPKAQPQSQMSAPRGRHLARSPQIVLRFLVSQSARARESCSPRPRRLSRLAAPRRTPAWPAGHCCCCLSAPEPCFHPGAISAADKSPGSRELIWTWAPRAEDCTGWRRSPKRYRGPLKSSR